MAKTGERGIELRSGAMVGVSEMFRQWQLVPIVYRRVAHVEELEVLTAVLQLVVAWIYQHKECCNDFRANVMRGVEIVTLVHQRSMTCLCHMQGMERHASHKDDSKSLMLIYCYWRKGIISSISKSAENI